jgi:hypothetical protein
LLLLHLPRHVPPPPTPHSESYAGIYVPMLAQQVVKGNRKGRHPHINLKVSALSLFLSLSATLSGWARRLADTAPCPITPPHTDTQHTHTHHTLRAILLATAAPTKALMATLACPLLSASPSSLLPCTRACRRRAGATTGTWPRAAGVSGWTAARWCACGVCGGLGSDSGQRECAAHSHDALTTHPCTGVTRCWLSCQRS